GSGPSTTTPTTLPTVPTLSVPPTLPRGEVVRETLRWEEVSLDGAISVGAAITWEGTHWVAGSDEDGLAVWSSADGDRWDKVAEIGDSQDWTVTDLEEADGELAMAATGPQEGALFTSRDGVVWRRHRLPSDDPERPLASPHEVIATDAAVLVRGTWRAQTDVSGLEDSISPQLVALVEAGHARLSHRPEGVTFTISPGLDVATVPTGELPEDQSIFTPPTSALWSGPSAAELTGADVSRFPPRVEEMESGELVGRLGNRFATSPDGEDWEPDGPVLDSMTDFVPWMEGVVAATFDQGLRYWEPGAAETSAVMPRGPVGQSAPVHSLLTGENWGLAMLTTDSSGAALIDTAEVTTVSRGQLHVSSASRLRLVRDGETVWRRRLDTLPVHLDEQGRLVLGPETDPAVVQVDDWLEAVETILRRAGTSHVIHTPDARRWSSTRWQDLFAEPANGEASLLSTADFVVAVDEDPRRRQARMSLGHPSG
ncbi:MAG: hypothetical protein ACLFWM_13720, partial [Actinomycetota bacterium]